MASATIARPRATVTRQEQNAVTVPGELDNIGESGAFPTAREPHPLLGKVTQNIYVVNADPIKRGPGGIPRTRTAWLRASAAGGIPTSVFRAERVARGDDSPLDFDRTNFPVPSRKVDPERSAEETGRHRFASGVTPSAYDTLSTLAKLPEAGLQRFERVFQNKMLQGKSGNPPVADSCIEEGTILFKRDLIQTMAERHKELDRDPECSEPYAVEDKWGITEVVARVTDDTYRGFYGDRASNMLWPVLHGLISKQVGESRVVYPGSYNEDSNQSAWAVAYRLANLILSPDVEGSAIDPATGLPRPGAVINVDDFHLDNTLPYALRDLFEQRFGHVEGAVCPAIVGFAHTPRMTTESFRQYCAEVAPSEWQGPDGEVKAHHFGDLLSSYLSATFASDVVGCQSPRDASDLLAMAKEYSALTSDSDSRIRPEDQMRLEVDEMQGEVKVFRGGEYLHTSRVVATPVSVEYTEIEEEGGYPHIDALEKRLEKCGIDKVPLIASVQRLDITKNVLGQVQAIEKFLEIHPELIGKIGFLIAAKATREDVPTDVYHREATLTQEAVDRINAKFKEKGWIPICYVNEKGLPPQEVIAMYRRRLTIGAMAISVRDGQTLVGHELFASKSFGDCAALIISEGCGASATLGAHGAIVIEDQTNSSEIVRGLEKVILPYVSGSHEFLIDCQRRGREFVMRYTAVDWGNRLLQEGLAMALRNRARLSPPRNISFRDFMPAPSRELGGEISMDGMSLPPLREVF